MRKVYLMLLLLVFALFAKAQMSVGLSFAMPTWRPLNSVIDRYNNTRPWLDKEMGNVHFMPGWTIAPGVTFGNGKLACQFASIRKSSARVTAKGNDDKRDLSIRMWTFSLIDFTYYPISLGRFSLGAGAQPIEISRLKIRGRVNDDKFEEYWKTPALANLFISNASSTLHVDFRYRIHAEKQRYLQFRLYYMLSWWHDEHMVFVNDKLNGSAAANNHYATQNQGLNHMGLQILLSLF